MLYVGHTHCASCGAKWIQNRITMRQVGMDFTDMYLGLDTKFVHTFVDLFRKPGEVITGYINGRRVYYMDAIRYLLLALFVTGIYMFIMRSSGALDQYMNEFQTGWSHASVDGENNQKAFEIQQRVTDTIFDYLSVLTLLTIPLLAFVGRITFWGKRYFNFTEHIVFYLYTFAHITIATTPISLMLLWISPEAFTYWSLLTYPIMFVYNAYCYKRCFKIDWQTTILKSLISVIILIISMVLFFLLAILLIFLSAMIADKLGYDVKGFFEANFA
jgi:hypothetical protein